MRNWKESEKYLLDWLKENFKEPVYRVEHKGGSNSTDVDATIFNLEKGTETNAEFKTENAQSGQFVALPENGVLIFSERNVVDRVVSEEILIEMNNEFLKYSNPGTSGIIVDIKDELSYKWIVNHYKGTKQSDYFVVDAESRSEVLMFKTVDIMNYFDVKAVYRKKKSGSTHVPAKDKKGIQEKAFELYGGDWSIIGEGTPLVLKSNKELEERTILLSNENYDYFISKKSNGNEYLIRRLSNTNNPNVIFEIKLKNEYPPINLDGIKKEI